MCRAAGQHTAEQALHEHCSTDVGSLNGLSGFEGSMRARAAGSLWKASNSFRSAVATDCSSSSSSQGEVLQHPAVAAGVVSWLSVAPNCPWHQPLGIHTHICYRLLPLLYSVCLHTVTVQVAAAGCPSCWHITVSHSRSLSVQPRPGATTHLLLCQDAQPLRQLLVLGRVLACCLQLLSRLVSAYKTGHTPHNHTHVKPLPRSPGIHSRLPSRLKSVHEALVC